MKLLFFILFPILLNAQFSGFNHWRGFPPHDDTTATIVTDTWPPTITTVGLDTLGNDSLKLVLNGFTQEADINYWIVFSDTLSKLDTIGANIGDSVIYSQDTTAIDTIHWKWTGTDGIFKYSKVFVSDSVPNFTTYIDSINVSYSTVPDAGIITINGYLQYNDLDISLNYGGNDNIDYTTISIAPDTSRSFILMATLYDTSIARDTLDLYSISLDAQNHLMVIRLGITNIGAITTFSYDTLDYSAVTRYFTMAADTGDTTLSLARALRLYTSADSNSTVLDSFFVDSMDFDLTQQANDSVFAYLDTLNWNGDTLWFAGAYEYGDSLGGTGIWYRYPQPSAGGGGVTLWDSVSYAWTFDAGTVVDDKGVEDWTVNSAVDYIYDTAVTDSAVSLTNNVQHLSNATFDPSGGDDTDMFICFRINKAAQNARGIFQFLDSGGNQDGIAGFSFYNVDQYNIQIRRYEGYADVRDTLVVNIQASTYYTISWSFDASASTATWWISQSSFGDIANGLTHVGIAGRSIGTQPTAGTAYLGYDPTNNGMAGYLNNFLIGKGATLTATEAEAYYNNSYGRP